MRFLRGALQNYFPIAGTETLFDPFQELIFSLQNYFPIAGTETNRLGPYGCGQPLQNYFPIAGTETMVASLIRDNIFLQNYFPIAGTETPVIGGKFPNPPLFRITSPLRGLKRLLFERKSKKFSALELLPHCGD